MRFIIFLLSLCCFLSNSNTTALAASYHSDMSHAHIPRNNKQPHKHHRLKADKVRSVYETSQPITLEESLNNDEDIDENDDQSGDQFQDRHLVHKKVLYQHSLSYVSSSYPAVVHHYCSYLSASQFHFQFNTASDRYLLLGVLRI